MIGKSFSHYEIISKLGEGGMGQVWEAHDSRLGRIVALKLIPKHLNSDPTARQRFVHEAKAASSMEHANICTIHEIDETPDGETFIVMPRYQGEPLSERIARGPLPLEEVLRIAEEIADGLAEAHDHGLVHRDVKPANIIIEPSGRPILLDFGLAKISTRTQLTRTGTTLGTLSYMAPEQAAGRDLDGRADMFSLGVILQEMVTGVRPFEGDHDAAVLYSIAHQPAPPLSDHNHSLPSGLQSIVDRALAKEPKDRFASMVEFRDAVRDLRLELQMLSGSRSKKYVRPVKRIRWWVPVTLVFLLGAVGGIFALRSRQAPSPREDVVIAVLPLEDLSGDQDQQNFADGFTGELIAGLTRVEGLKVMARGSVLEFRDSDLTVKQMAEMLHVNKVVTGTIQQENQVLRATVEIIDTERGLALWADTFDGSEEGILKLQGNMTRSIVEALKGGVTPGEEELFSGAGKIDPEAYRAYLKGKALEDTWGDGEVWQQILTLFRQAARIEPEFAPAFAGQSRIYNYLGWFNPEMGYPEMCKTAALKALELDPDLPEAQSALAEYLFLYENRVEEAQRLFAKALDTAPNNVQVLESYGTFLMLSGQCDEAIRVRRLCAELDPLNFSPSRDLANALVNCGHFEESIALINLLKDRFKGETTHLDYFLAGCYANLGQIDQAMEAAKRSGMSPRTMAPVYWLAGQKDEAWESIGGREGQDPNSVISRVFLLVFEEDYESAMDILEQGVKERPILTRFILIDPFLDPLHDQPRFRELMRSLNYPGY